MSDAEADAHFEMERHKEQEVEEYGSPCPRCDGTGRYQRLPQSTPAPCAVCEGQGRLGENGEPFCKHEWEGKKIYIPGEPDDYVEYCKHCGMENPGSWME